MSDQPLMHADAGAMIDVGPNGYQLLMTVYRNDKATRENLEAAQVSHAYGALALAVGAHLVGFSSLPDGRGEWQVIPMSATYAERYPVGSTVVFHWRKDKEIGFGRHVAISILA